MRKFLSALLLFLLFVSLWGCGDSNLSAENEELKNRISEMEEALSAAGIEVDDESAIMPGSELNSSSEKFSEIIFEVTDKKNIQQTYSEFIEIVHRVTNNYDKDIKGIEGILHIKDMFGKDILSASWDITSNTIPASGHIDIRNYGLDYNQFLDTHQKIYDTAYENLIFEYEVTSVLFTDGTTIQ